MDALTGHIPTGGFPKSLWNILNVLFEHNDLRSWQIYSEQKGLTVKLRFDDAQNGGQTMYEDKVSFVRKPPAQVRRDMKRSDEYKRQTRSQTKKGTTHQESPEIPRSSNIDVDILSQVAGDSPASVHIDHVGLAMSRTPDPLLSSSWLTDQLASSDGSIDSVSETSTEARVY